MAVSVSSSPVGLPLLSISVVPGAVEVLVFAKLWIPKHQVAHAFVAPLRPQTLLPSVRQMSIVHACFSLAQNGHLSSGPTNGQFL